MTGFTSFAYDMGGKWLELLKEIAPRVTRLAVIRDSATIWWSRSVHRDSNGGAIVRNGGEPDQLRDPRELERPFQHLRALRMGA